jgi:hypothetical protein
LALARFIEDISLDLATGAKYVQQGKELIEKHYKKEDLQQKMKEFIFASI